MLKQSVPLALCSLVVLGLIMLLTDCIPEGVAFLAIVAVILAFISTKKK